MRADLRELLVTTEADNIMGVIYLSGVQQALILTYRGQTEGD